MNSIWLNFLLKITVVSFFCQNKFVASKAYHYINKYDNNNTLNKSFFRIYSINEVFCHLKKFEYL